MRVVDCCIALAAECGLLNWAWPAIQTGWRAQPSHRARPIEIFLAPTEVLVHEVSR